MSNAVAQIKDGDLIQIEQARERWLAASAQTSKIACEIFQPNSGYGCLEAEKHDRHRLETARIDAERLLQEYADLDRRYIQHHMLRLQHSQRLATWASFAVAAVVGVATIGNIIFQIVK